MTARSAATSGAGGAEGDVAGRCSRGSRRTRGAWPETKATDVMVRHTITSSRLYTDPSAIVLTLNKPGRPLSQGDKNRKRLGNGQFCPENLGGCPENGPCRLFSADRTLFREAGPHVVLRFGRVECLAGHPLL